MKSALYVYSLITDEFTIKIISSDKIHRTIPVITLTQERVATRPYININLYLYQGRNHLKLMK